MTLGEGEYSFACTNKEVRVVKNTGYNISTSVVEGKGTIKDSFDIAYGEDALITFKPDVGYKLEKVLVNGTDLTKEVKDEKLTIKEVFRDYNVEVSYSLIEKETQINTETTIENPKTIDSIVICFIVAIISIVGIISVFAYKKRYN